MGESRNFWAANPSTKAATSAAAMVTSKGAWCNMHRVYRGRFLGDFGRGGAIAHLGLTWKQPVAEGSALAGTEGVSQGQGGALRLTFSALGAAGRTRAFSPWSYSPDARFQPVELLAGRALSARGATRRTRACDSQSHRW